MLNVFCDWLDVTFGPTDCPYPELNLLLLGLGMEVEYSDHTTRRYSVPTKDPCLRGTLVIEHRPTFARVSLSGGVCEFLRERDSFGELLSILGTSPHRVSRLDATLDLAMDGADLVDSLRKRHSDGFATLTRKALPTTTMLSIREDGRESGTWYVGHRTRARVTARVYDKALQMLSKYGALLPPTARVEITIREGATLRDAAEPTACFWHYAAPAILKAPEDIPMWTQDTENGWTGPKREFDPAALLKRRVEACAELDALLDVADLLGPSGRAYLASLLERRVRASEDALDLAS